MIFDPARVPSYKYLSIFLDHIHHAARANRGLAPANETLVRLDLYVDVISRVVLAATGYWNCLD